MEQVLDKLLDADILFGLVGGLVAIVAIVVGLSALLSTLLAHSLFPARPSIWFWSGPFVVATIGYALAWFGPGPLAGADRGRSLGFGAIRGEDGGVHYDAPRDQPWSGPADWARFPPDGGGQACAVQDIRSPRRTPGT